MVLLWWEERTSTCSHETDEQGGRSGRALLCSAVWTFRYQSSFLLLLSLHLRVSSDIRGHRTGFTRTLLKQVGKAQRICKSGCG